jgi:hypothetical protein
MEASAMWFGAVTIAPEGTGDIPDGDEARLVILHPRLTLQRNGVESPAQAFAREALTTRGSAQRRHRNALVFLAPDARRMLELEAAVGTAPGLVDSGGGWVRPRLRHG